MATVFTPECVKRMVKAGTFREVAVKDLNETFCDEAFYFRFPSPNIVNEINGDGDWLEIEDYHCDNSAGAPYRARLFVEGRSGSIEVTPDTIVYVK